VPNASDAGRTIYEKIGFLSAPETMRLSIESNCTKHPARDLHGLRTFRPLSSATYAYQIYLGDFISTLGLILWKKQGKVMERIVTLKP
jgi:hypothetical protein